VLPVAKVTSIRLCGAMVFNSWVHNVMVNGLPICTIGSLDSHGGMAITGSLSVYANGLRVCRFGDINDICRWRYPRPHIAQPLVICDHNVYSM
jgi:hypothetical protein